MHNPSTVEPVYRRCRWLLGEGLTLPLPFSKRRRAVVFYKRGMPALRTYAHELVHVRQVATWGSWGYLRRHIWERVKARNLYVVSSYVEVEAYAAGDAVEKAR